MSFSIVPHVKYKSPSMLPQAIDQAIALHQTGSLSAAERLYLEILKRNPNHFEAQHFLGILRHQQGRNTEASDLIGRALKTKPDEPGALSNYGLVLIALNRHRDALASFEKALAVKPKSAELLNNRGNVLRELNRPEDALKSFDKALAVNPYYAAAWNNRGNIHASQALREKQSPSGQNQRWWTVSAPPHLSLRYSRNRDRESPLHEPLTPFELVQHPVLFSNCRTAGRGMQRQPCSPLPLASHGLWAMRSCTSPSDRSRSVGR
jgi:Tfp pilus assembly protein PilF